jgi:type IV secretion system protein VirB6
MYKVHKVIRTLLLLILFLAGTCHQYSANASGWCGGGGDGCPRKCPGGAYLKTDDDTPEKGPILCSGPIDQDLGLGKVAIGWGKNCAMYSGGTSVSDKSCLPAGSTIKEVLDTIGTLGLARNMKKGFCSFAPGDPTLEGAFISKNFLKQCDPYGPEARANCVKCLFDGRKFDGQQCLAGDCSDTGDLKNECATCQFNGGVFQGGKCKMDISPLEEPDSSNSSYTAEPCEGIPNLEKPLLDDSSGRQVFINVLNMENPSFDPGGLPTPNIESIPVFCPLTRCNIPTNDIKVKYRDDFLTRLHLLTMLGIGPALSLPTAALQDCCDMTALKDGQRKSVGIFSLVQLRGQKQSDQMCVQMLFGLTGWTTLACKPRVAPKINFADLPCFVKNSSCAKGNSHSKWFLPITSKVMECTTDVFSALFRNNKCTNGLLELQKNMQGIVRLLLALYIIIFGIQIAFGKAISKPEFFSFVLKFALVVFFAVGNLYKAGVSADVNKNGLMFLRELMNSGMVSFSEMVMSASGGITKGTGDGLCDFSKFQYDQDGIGGDYNYLKVWDALDCRLTFYLGLASPTSEGLTMVKGGGGAMKIGRGILNMLWGLLFSWRLPIIIFLLLFTIFLLSMVVHLVHLYILAMIAVSILIFFGPIFIPLALFEKTKGFCDQWVKLLVGYSLQPVMVLAIISFMLITFDKILFTDCSFKSGLLANGTPYWVMDEVYPNPTPTCQKSLGYMVQFFSDRALTRVSADEEGGNPLFYYNTVKDDIVISTGAIISNFTSLLEGLMFGTFFAFLFYFFAGQMSALATELSSSPDLSKYAAGATAVWDGAVNAVKRGRFSKANAAGAGTDSGSQASRGGVDSGSQATIKNGTGTSVAVGSSIGGSQARPPSTT